MQIKSQQSVCVPRFPATPTTLRALFVVTSARKARPFNLVDDVSDVFQQLDVVKEDMKEIKGNMNLSMLLGVVSTASTAGMFFLMMSGLVK